MHGTHQQNVSHTKANPGWGKATSRSPIKPRTLTRRWPVNGDPRPRIARLLRATAISQCETSRLGKTCEWVRFWNHGSVSRGCALSFSPTNHLRPTRCPRLLRVGTGRDECVPPVPRIPRAQPFFAYRPVCMSDLFSTHRYTALTLWLRATRTRRPFATITNNASYYLLGCAQACL
jgi:hypothetical protein